MSLFQKIQPKTLDEIVGNSTTIKAIKSMLKQELKPHVFLLKGPKGCGKTTIAEIMANELGCTALGKEIYDTANTRGIDTIRSIIEEAPLSPIGGGNKVFILDESHQLTSDAMSALLRITNNPPSHCYFIFCTTDPNDMIPTLRDRCTQYEVGVLGKDDITKLLQNVCKKENLKVDDSIIEVISLTCDGTPRTALVSLEQVLGINNVDEAIELLVKGTEKDTSVLELCKLLVMYPQKRLENWKKILETLNRIKADNETIRYSILGFIYNRLLRTDKIEDAKDLAKLLDIFGRSTMYSGKNGLGLLIVKACFGE